jgi:hypothetical protein
MRARVLQLGGDTLLFGERGRSGRLRDVPPEIVQRRNEILEAAEPNGGRRRAAEMPTEQIPASPGELWYYGAALRCNLE